MAAPAWLRRQLSGPRGFLARPMAHLLNRGNGADITRAVGRLGDVRGLDVLELGFGGGLGLRLLLAQGARVCGVEPSTEMRARAFRKHAWDLASGRLTVIDARAEALPTCRSADGGAEGPFDHALSMNTVYFWEDLDAGMAELARVVRTSVILGVAPPAHLVAMGFPDSGFRAEPPEHYARHLGAAGFEVTVEPPPGPHGCALVIGVRRGSSQGAPGGRAVSEG